MGTRLGDNAFWSKSNPVMGSVLIHVLLLLAIVGVLRAPVKLAVYRLPGTQNGLRLLTYYSPGSTTPAQSDITAKTTKPQQPQKITHTATAPVVPEAATTASADRGVGNTSASGLGDGNITIALEKYFPYPKPSLAALPPGFNGDVILNAVIDEHGKVTQLTLLHGVGSPIDDQVMQTVEQWTYVPAMKNGIPVASVQELHFHYERRG
jgi:protein TonB